MCKPIVESEYMCSIIGSRGYVAYSVAWSLVYLIPSSIGAFLAFKMLNTRSNFTLTLIAMLSFCMAVSACLSLIMTSKGNYYALLDLKAWWKDIYLSIEILIAFIVGGNGLNYLAHVDICPHGKRNAIIRHNVNSNQGKQQ